MIGDRREAMLLNFFGWQQYGHALDVLGERTIGGERRTHTALQVSTMDRLWRLRLIMLMSRRRELIQD